MRRILSVLFALLVCAPFVARAAEITAAKAVVATANPEATQAALNVLRDGGNAYDAAVVAALVLSVAEPQSSGLGGGGFATLYDAKTKKVRCLDFRERAPVLAHRDLYVREGVPRPELSRTGALAVAVPGQVAGLYELHKKYGRKPFAALVEPALKLATSGVTVSGRLGASFKQHEATLAQFESTKSAWAPAGKFPSTGAKWQQAELAKTLRAIAQRGPDGFYKGEVAKKLVDAVVQNGGIMSLMDLSEYEVKWRDPVSTGYRGYEVYSMPPPSSGGVHLAQLLNMAEPKDVKAMGLRSPELLHFAIEAMRRAYADRAEYLGDPGFTVVPVQGLLSKDYAKKLAAGIDAKVASKSDAIGPGKPPGAESKDTTHFSIIDAEGNAVAITTTVNGPFGSALVAAGTGVLLNNEMDDFATAPGQPNFFGLVGGEANSVAPRKTPLSSMTPTVVLKDGQLRWVLGAPGGSTIITTVFWALLHLIDFGADAQTAIAMPRVHQQWKPDTVMIEQFGVDAATDKALRALGHSLTYAPAWGNAQIVGVLPDGQRIGASDPRGDGVALGF